MKILHFLLVFFCLFLVSRLFGQDETPASSWKKQHVQVNLRNTSATDGRGVKLRIIRLAGPHGSSAEDSVFWQQVLPGENLLWTVTTGAEGDFYGELYVDSSAADGVQKSGASFVLSPQGDLAGLRFIGNVGFRNVDAPAPSYSVTLKDFSIPDYAKPLWETGDATLTGTLFREGVDKLYSALAAGSASSGSGGAVGSDPASLSDRERVATATIQANQLVDFTDLTPPVTKSSMQEAGLAAATEMSAVLPSSSMVVAPKISGRQRSRNCFRSFSLRRFLERRSI